MRKLKLAQKISLLVVVIVMISVGISIYVAGQYNIKSLMEKVKENTLNTVQIVAMSPIIIDGIANKESQEIQKFVEATQQQLKSIDIIVVADVNGKRYGHTKSNRVGKMFSAYDNDRAVLYGETYVSEGPGTLGPSLRAFTPITNHDGKILGFVMAGTLLDSIAKTKQDIALIMVLFILMGCFIGVLGAVYVSRYIKKSLLGYEPENIARLYLENKGILATVHEGVIAVNQDYVITLINEQAMRYLGICKDFVVGKNIKEVFPQSKLPLAMEQQTAMLDVPYALQDVIVVSNNVPILSEQNIVVGGVSSFRDQTEVNKLAEEITGVKKIVDSLRATTHEFKNKLHVILGFIETNNTNKAKEYIGTINNQIQSNISNVLNMIFEPTISALCIGKCQRGNEIKVDFHLHEDCYFENSFNFDVNALVVIIGNLIENAMDNLEYLDKHDKQVELYLNDQDNQLEIVVKDNGSGIEDTRKIFEKGYTTKQKSRGYGLYLVKQNVEKYNGSIKVDTKLNEGSEFHIIFKQVKHK